MDVEGAEAAATKCAEATACLHAHESAVKAAESSAGPHAHRGAMEAADAANAAAGPNATHRGAMEAADTAARNAAGSGQGAGRSSRRHRQGRNTGDDCPGNRVAHDQPPIAGSCWIGVPTLHGRHLPGSYRRCFPGGLIYDKSEADLRQGDASEENPFECADRSRGLLVRGCNTTVSLSGHADSHRLEANVIICRAAAEGE
ncbi:MAG TPA: hypothetical protein VFE63_11810 [Roseiarcus sp.]|jgi:hypothetical protein|nr:hypothetical protein [Roseiarcus sp.]